VHIQEDAKANPLRLNRQLQTQTAINLSPGSQLVRLTPSEVAPVDKNWYYSINYQNPKPVFLIFAHEHTHRINTAIF
jgi:hypothetical protein